MKERKTSDYERKIDNDRSIEKEERRGGLLESFAIFGDSSYSLIASFLLLAISVSLALLLDKEPKTTSDAGYRQRMGPVPAIDPPYVFEIEPTMGRKNLVSAEMKRAFNQDGVIAVRGVINEDDLKLLDEATRGMLLEQEEKNSKKPKTLSGRKQAAQQFYTVTQGPIFLDFADDSRQAIQPFSKLALFSQIPKLAAELLQLNEERNETLRLMRDIFLAKDEEEYVCGWHVDDTGFWPATAEAPGVNAWVALDDMPTERGGGFALAVGSHKATWREEAYHKIGSTHTFPKEGFQSAVDLVENRVGNGTCNLKTAAPHLHQRMEETMRIYDLKRGDVIFHTRWLFHRTVPFKRNAVADRISNHEEPLLYRRYSIRYGPGYSEIPRGFGFEPSVLWDERNAGRTADQVSQLDAPWYPKVWPFVSDDELKQMEMIAGQRMAIAMEKSQARRKLIKPRRNKNNFGYSRQPH